MNNIYFQNTHDDRILHVQKLSTREYDTSDFTLNISKIPNKNLCYTWSISLIFNTSTNFYRMFQLGYFNLLK